MRNLRWWIAGLIVAASVLNYLDRTALSVASAVIRDELRLSNEQYAQITNGFLVAYTFSYLFGGMLVDRIGTRLALAGTISLWSLANMAHALAQRLSHLVGFRAVLALGEAAFYPAAMRSLSEWFHPRDRAKPTGMLLAGASLGALLAPIIVAGMMRVEWLGWRGAFVVTGALGFLLAPPLLLLARPPHRNPLLSPEERAYLGPLAENAGAHTEPAPPLRRVLAHPGAWVLLIARMLTDAAWYLLLFWLLLYLQKQRGWSVEMVALYGWIPFAAADLGALAGGWLSSALVARGMPVLRARAVCMFGFALLLPASLAAYSLPVESQAAAVALFSLATFGHMAWGANSLTLHGDLFPANCVATVVGVTGAAGAMGGVMAQQILAPWVDRLGHYGPVFVATAVLHPVAAVLILTCIPRFRPALPSVAPA
jgi:ACS family hexuronate transporter-like MFS transporter